MLLTSLPLPTFKESARVLLLDDLRSSIESGIWILEHPILSINENIDPIRYMWKGYEGCLQLYVKTFLSELKNRGEEVGVLETKTKDYKMSLDKIPWWFFEDMKEKERVMNSHQIHLSTNNVGYQISFLNLRFRGKKGIHYPPYRPTIVDPVLIGEV